MGEDREQEQIAAMVGTLSTIDRQIQEIEETTLQRANVFLEKAAQTDTPEFNTMGHLLKEIHRDLHEIRKHINEIRRFIRQ